MVSSLFVFCQIYTLTFLNFTFCLNRSNCCWCFLLGRFDIHLCVSTGRSLTVPWCIPTDAVCGWSAPTISSVLANLVLLLELSHLLHRHLSDQAYKLFQCNFILLYAIVQTVKISVTILTELYLLPYQTAIIQWRSFDKNICTNFNWISLLKSKQNYSSLQNTHFNEKLSI